MAFTPFTGVSTKEEREGKRKKRREKRHNLYQLPFYLAD